MSRLVQKSRDLVYMNSLWKRHSLPVFTHDRVIDGWRLRLRPSTHLTRATTFEMKEALDIAQDKRHLPTFVRKNSASHTFIAGSFVNLSQRGSFNKDLNPETPYAHMLLHVHETHRTGRDTLLAIVLMPRGQQLPVTVVREAFLGSLKNDAEAWIIK